MSTLLHPLLRQFQASPTDRAKALDLLKQQLLKGASSVDGDVNAQSTSTASKITTAANCTPSNSLFTRCFDRPKPVAKTMHSPRKELDEYMSMDFQPYETDVLSFWRKYSDTFPSLSSLARELSAIPAANTSIERLFTASKNRDTERRTRLAADELNKLLFLLKKNVFCLSRMNEPSSSVDRVHSKRSLSGLNDDEISVDGHEESLPKTSAKKPREADYDDCSTEIGNTLQGDVDELMA